MQRSRSFAPPAGATAVPFFALDEVGLAQSEVFSIAVGTQLAGTSGAHIPARAPGSPEVTFLGIVADPQAFAGGPTDAIQRGGIIAEDNAGLPSTAPPVGMPSTLTDLIGSLP